MGTNAQEKISAIWGGQKSRNDALLAASRYMRDEVTSEVLPLTIHPQKAQSLSDQQALALEGAGKEAARIAIRSLASLAKIGELDHLGGGLDLIPALMMTLSMTDYKKVHYTIEHAHTSIGYYSCLAALGFLDEDLVVEGFRRSLDIAGHVSWVPGGTELNGGRLGVMIPAAVGQALGARALQGKDAWVICHCGDAGWISGQALNGFNAAELHNAPITFVMHRNGIQLSGSNKSIMDKDPRPIIESLGIKIIETPTLTDPDSLYKAYRKAKALAEKGRPSLIYPVGYRSKGSQKVTLETMGKKYGIMDEIKAFAAKNKVSMKKAIWIPGSFMSYRDLIPMLECLFLVNELPGGAGHHDGHMKGRDQAEVLANPMFREDDADKAYQKIRNSKKKTVVTKARPKTGSPNLVLSAEALNEVELPPVGKKSSPRAGSEAGYAAVAKAFPKQFFVVACDLDASTKLGKARKFLKPDRQFEMSIEEQASSIMANGLAVSSREPQLNVFSTFAAFFEGIAREGFEMWRYQRNLTGANEGLNVVQHLSHVGSCTGRDHFSGWSLDWVTLALGYLPYLHRFYAPADARAAFVAVRDMAAHYGGHIIGIPRDNLPVLEDSNGGPLYRADMPWENITTYRKNQGAKRVILALGAPAFLTDQATDELTTQGIPTDAYIVNALPVSGEELRGLLEQYPEGVVTIEDGLIGCRETGVRGFASVVSTVAAGRSIPIDHVGIIDPRIAPSQGQMETWEHFGITKSALVEAVKNL